MTTILKLDIQYDYLDIAAQVIYSRAWCMGLIISHIHSYLTTGTVHLQRFYEWLIQHKKLVIIRPPSIMPA